MVMFALNRTEIDNGYNNAVANPYDPIRDSGASWYEGALTAIPKGFEQGGAEIGLAISGGSQHAQDVVKSLRPDPMATGWLGNVLQGVSSIIPSAIAGTVAAGGNPVGGGVAVGEVKGYARMKELQAEGVDEKTASIVGAIEGITQGAGLLVPASVSGNAAKRILSGAGINMNIGAIERGATSKTLDMNGYKEMADQYRVVDGLALLTDAIIGGLFGGLHAETRMPSEVDAALAANNIHQLEIESAPGIPTDMATRNAHVDAMNIATEQVLRGEPVDIGKNISDTNFLAKPVNEETRLATVEAIKDNGLQDVFTKEVAAKIMEPVKAENIYADAAAKVAEMPDDIAKQRFELLNKKLEDGNLSTKDMPLREALSERFSPTKIAKSPEMQIVENKPDLQIVHESGEVTTAKEALARVDEEIAQAKKDKRIFDAAVNCFIGNGDA